MKKSSTPMPVMLHPKLSRIATQPSDLFNRMNFYASSISSQIKNPNFKLTLLVGIHFSELPANLNVTYPHLQVIRISDPTFNFRLFAKQCQIFLGENQINPNIFIAGDMTLGLMSCIYARIIDNLQIPIQISVHGSFFSKDRSIISFAKSLFRIILLKSLISSVDSVRVVSPQVMREMIESFHVNPKKTFIAPIPFESYPDFQHRDFQSVTLGVIGRLHSERNVNEILNILNVVLDNAKIKKVILIGNGPLEKMVHAWKSRSTYSEKISLKGFLPHNEVKESLSEIDIVLSAAHSEGYGLAIREALLSGAIVVARRNEGTMQIEESFQSGIFLYDSLIEAVQIIAKLTSGIEQPVQCTSGRKIQETIDCKSLIEICKSWTAI